jgi:hypothetical protein
MPAAGAYRQAYKKMPTHAVLLVTSESHPSTAHNIVLAFSGCCRNLRVWPAFFALDVRFS